MGLNDGSVQNGVVSMRPENGDPERRWNVLILPEGYQQGELAQFHTDVQQFWSTLAQAPPFMEFQQAINLFCIDVVSAESGTDDPAACGGSGTMCRTFFDGTLCGDGVTRRLLTVDEGIVQAVVNERFPSAHITMVMVNTSLYGGSGGDIATFSTHPDSIEIALHELGHTAFQLADEYESLPGCDQEADDTYYRYTGPEPENPNVTTVGAAENLKWAGIVTASALPTTTNADPTHCDPQPNPFADGTVGTYEGALYHHAGIYRPAFNCRMRTLGVPYCPVCQQAIRAILGRYGSS